MSSTKEPYMGLEHFVNSGLNAVKGKSVESHGGYVIRESGDGQHIFFVSLEKRSNGATIPKHHTVVPKADIPNVIAELQKIQGSV